MEKTMSDWTHDDWRKNHALADKFRRDKITMLKEGVALGGVLKESVRGFVGVWNKQDWNTVEEQWNKEDKAEQQWK